jgi:hypothetical protein
MFICAWCGVLLRLPPDPECAIVNYGICPQCLESRLKALDQVKGVRPVNGRKPGLRRRRKGPAGCAKGVSSVSEPLPT